MTSKSRWSRLRPSPGAAIGVVALVFALSGVAVALPGKNKVDSNDIKKNAVTTKTLKNGAVTGAKLGAGAVTEAKLGDGAVSTSKLGNDAVTGAKVNEATLGTVPAATKATTADKATSADKATAADTAATATTATTAATATNAEALAGRDLQQVRSLSDAVQDTSAEGLDDVAFQEVMTVDISIPFGGADLIANASFELDNETGSQAGAQCELRSDGVVISSRVTITMTNGFNYSVSLTGYANNLPGTGFPDPENVGVFCQGSIVDNGVDFIEGNLVVQRIPSGV